MLIKFKHRCLSLFLLQEGNYPKFSYENYKIFTMHTDILEKINKFYQRFFIAMHHDQQKNIENRMKAENVNVSRNDLGIKKNNKYLLFTKNNYLI